MIEYKPKVDVIAKQRRETSALGLNFIVKPKYVGVGLKLECTASIGSVYWQSFQEKIPVSPREQAAISGNWWTSSQATSKSKYSCKIVKINFMIKKKKKKSNLQIFLIS